MKRLITLIFAFILMQTTSYSQAPTNLFVWNYEDLNLTVDVDNALGTPVMTESGLTSLNYFTGINATCSGTTTGTNARSGQGWATGDYWQFEVNTTGFTDLTFSTCLRSSAGSTTGNYRIRASLDGSAWTNLGADFNFGSGTAVIISVTRTLDVTFNNQPTVYIQVYKVDNPSAGDPAIRIDNVTLTSAPPPPVLFYRSVASGLYSANTTWESSIDNTSWTSATRPPASTDNTVTIQSPNTVTIDAATTLDQVVIKNGAVLAQAANSGAITVNDGTGDDIIIENGGVFLLNGVNTTTPTPQTYGSRIIMGGSSGLRVESGGIVRIGDGVNSFVGTGFAGFPTNVNTTWQNGAIFEWNNQSNLPFQGDFFPNAAAGVVPILRSTVPVPGFGGSTATFSLKGRLEANAILHVGGTGTKFYRDGINNADSLVFGNTVGKVTIGNGSTTTVLSGAGAIAIPALGCDIAAGTNITLINSKTFVSSTLGGVGLNLTTGFITLGSSNLNVIGTAGRITGSANGYVITNSTGKLLMDSIGATGTTTAVLFPVGPSASLYHPAIITNTGTMDSLSVNVSSIITGACVAEPYTVNAKWDVSENTVGGSDCTFVLDYTGATTGASYNATTAKISHCDITNTLDYTNGSVTGTVATGSGFTSFSPFFISSDIILPVILTQFIGTKNANTINLNWSVANEVNLRKYIVQRSTNGVDFKNIATVTAARQNNYSATDLLPVDGSNYYRLQMVDVDGSSNYSKIVKLDMSNKKSDIKVYPTITSGVLYILSNDNSYKNYSLFSIEGKQVLNGNMTDAKELNLTSIQGGTYVLKIGNQNFKIIKN